MRSSAISPMLDSRRRRARSVSTRSGREVVSYAPGDVVWPDHFDLLEHDDALAEVARLIRRYHDVVASFVPPPGAVWWDLAADPSGVHELVCHNDLAPWNLVRGADGSWTFIDWDLAAPGRRAWDLGWSLLAFIPLTPDRPLDDAAIARRLRVFMDALRVGGRARGGARGCDRARGARGREQGREARRDLGRRSRACVGERRRMGTAQPNVNEYAWMPGEKRSSSSALLSDCFDARTV